MTLSFVVKTRRVQSGLMLGIENGGLPDQCEVVGGLLAIAFMPSSCNAEVRIGGRASVNSAAAFRYALDHHPGIRRLAARYDAAMMAQVQQNAVCNAAHRVKGRICR